MGGGDFPGTGIFSSSQDHFNAGLMYKHRRTLTKGHSKHTHLQSAAYAKGHHENLTKGSQKTHKRFTKASKKIYIKESDRKNVTEKNIRNDEIE